MPLGPDPQHARAALARLDAVRERVEAAEDDVLACLVVTGEPGPQRVLDDWLDQVVDTLRALGEGALDLGARLERHAAASPQEPGATGSAHEAGATGIRGSWEARP